MNGAFDVLDQLPVRIALPDLWQQQAIRSLGQRTDVIVNAPTGAGKTFVFESLVNSRALGLSRGGQQAVFTVPTRALANDKWREWRASGWDVGIATGDLAENLDAPVLVATLETQRERLLAGRGPRLLVIDEYQMIGDGRRGLNYELTIALAPPETQLLLLSGSVANPRDVAAWIERLGRRVEIVETHRRPVPLDDIPVAALPERAPKRVKNFWQRLAIGVLLSDYGPLLIFAPQRRAAEKIARKIAEALPDDDPIDLPDGELRRAAGADLARMLRKRVAWHHSGLSFTQRAGIIEPLAKAGQLRVIVATLGLAAGINFSVRSVFVGDTLYQDGPFQREVRPDELLQMFGRAGRRGLDEIGYVIAADRSPRLMDARPRQLRRSNKIDWPTLLRVMRRATEREESPFAAARDFCGRLFSEQRVRLGFLGNDDSAPASGKSGGLFGLGPVRHEIRNSAGDWEAERPASRGETPLDDAWIALDNQKARPALAVESVVRERLPKSSRLCRLDRLMPDRWKSRRYGLEMAVATQLKDEESAGRFALTRQARAWSGLPKAEALLTFEEIETLLPEVLGSHLNGAAVCGFIHQGTAVAALADFGSTTVSTITDSLGRPLIEPERRSVAIESETHYADEETGETRGAAAGSAARAWRELGLIDERGNPTDRGVIFSFFQHGEGLAVAAALEDPTYPIDELIWHLANLRASHRFEAGEASEASTGGSERLAIVCRQTFGPVDHEGYLRLGLPVGYGEGAAEAIEAWISGDSAAFRRTAADLEIGPGDVERAYVEWLSLLRHLRGAPDFENERWRALRAIASEELRRRPVESPLKDLPEFPHTVLNRHPQHRLHFRQIQSVG
ncbi:MAG: DEAD/DEAH box helicase [Verrucomicrobiae bacterium]|nr:DEAD/DEAH box helicase [Verrucomicrobiae bacterium]